MSGHTPGPWEVAGDRDVRTTVTGEGPVNGDWITYCHTVGDARLIAAAPSLLAACESAIVWLACATCRDPETTHPKAIENAKADLLKLQLAIARAGGKFGRGMDEPARKALAEVAP